MKILSSKVTVGDDMVIPGVLFPLKQEITFQGPYRDETHIVQIWARIDSYDGSYFLRIYDSYGEAMMGSKPSCSISGDNINLYIEAIARLSQEMKKPNSEEKG